MKTMHENDGVFMQDQKAEQILPGVADNWRAREARIKSEGRFNATMMALLAHGTTEDVDAATKALARVAAKAMRRR
jgi:hypothetical protein